MLGLDSQNGKSGECWLGQLKIEFNLAERERRDFV